MTLTNISWRRFLSCLTTERGTGRAPLSRRRREPTSARSPLFAYGPAHGAVPHSGGGRMWRYAVRGVTPWRNTLSGRAVAWHRKEGRRV